MSASPLKVAAVGTGYFSRFHYDAWRRLGVEVAGVCSLSQGDADTIAETFDGCCGFVDVEQMLDEVRPQLLDIIVPPDAHMAIIEAAAKRGIAMICQKPFTRSLEEAEAAVAVAARAGVPLLVHENFRFQPWHMKIKEMITDSMIGEAYQVSFRLRPGDGQGPDAYLGRQPYFQKMPRFLVHETAIHLIDVFRFFFGEMTSVMADLTRLNPHIAGEDTGVILFHFANGVRGLFDGNRLVDHVAEDRRRTIGDMLVEGSGGVIRLNGDGDIFYRKFGENDETPVIYSWRDAGFAGDSVFHLQKHIVDYLENGGDVANRAADYLTNLRIEQAVYHSDQLGARVALS